LIETSYEGVSIIRQCDLLSVPRSSYYYKPIPETAFNLLLMEEIDKQYLETPFYGRRLMTVCLERLGYKINHKRIQRLMKIMGLEAMYPKPRIKAWENRYGKFPYLLTNMEINAQNQVWATDITYIPVNNGYLYLVAFVDLFSRFVLSWRLSNSLESAFCVEALEMAFEHGKPRILNSDQGVQFCSHNYVELVKSRDIEISMSGKGRCWDNIFVERFWRSLKYEEVYLNRYECSEEASEGIGNYIELYNTKRPHSSLNYCTPLERYTTLLN
jgi:putative transposase